MPAADSSSTSKHARRYPPLDIEQITAWRSEGLTWQAITDRLDRTSMQNVYQTYRRKTEPEFEKWYHKRGREGSRKRRARLAEILIGAKDKPCVDCGVRLPAQCMDLDHVNGQKEFGASKHREHYVTYEELRAEIAKCVVRCPNCHRLRHYRERFSAPVSRQMKMAV